MLFPHDVIRAKKNVLDFSFVGAEPWFLYQKVDHFTVRTYGVNQAFPLAEGIWLPRKSRQIRFFGKDQC